MTKLTLLEKMTNEENKKIKEHVCEVIGLLGSNILVADGKNGKWDELVPYLYSCFENIGNLKAASLEVLATLFPYLFDNFMDDHVKLLEIFKKSLESEDVNTRISCFKALNSLFSIVDTQTALIFQDLVQYMLKSIDYILTSDSYLANKSIELIREILDNEPKIFKPSILHCFELVSHIFNKPDVDLSTKNSILDFIVSLCARMPKIINQNINLAEGIILRILEMMTSIEEDVDEGWIRPEEGFQDKEDEEGDMEFDYAKVGRKLIARLLDSVGDKYLLQPVLVLIQRALNSQND